MNYASFRNMTDMAEMVVREYSSMQSMRIVDVDSLGKFVARKQDDSTVPVPAAAAAEAQTDKAPVSLMA